MQNPLHQANLLVLEGTSLGLALALIREAPSNIRKVVL